MTPEQFEKKLRKLERRVCCLADSVSNLECSTIIMYDVTMSGNVSFGFSVNGEWGPFLAQTNGGDNNSLANIQVNGNDSVLVSIVGNSSLFDYSLIVTGSVDGVMFTQSDVNTDGQSIEFPFVVDCAQTYTITAVLDQHS